jgi:iron-sulfur cluster repair protein YtfE (RIC family)
MCCGHTGHHSHHHGGSCGCGEHGTHHGASCCCGGHARLGPSFWTKKEKIAWLEEYLESLREETKAVEERIAALSEEE